MILTLIQISRSQVALKLDYFLTCNIPDNIEAITFKLGMTVDLYVHGIFYAHARFDDLDLNARSNIVGRQWQKFSVELFRQLSKQQAFKLAITVGHFTWLCKRLCGLIIQFFFAASATTDCAQSLHHLCPEGLVQHGYLFSSILANKNSKYYN